MYDGVVTSIRIIRVDNITSPITLGSHQGSALIPYLIALLIDDLTRHIHDQVPWCMLFVDNIALIDENRAKINFRIVERKVKI